jgi:hypothetical protein
MAAAAGGWRGAAAEQLAGAARQANGVARVEPTTAYESEAAYRARLEAMPLTDCCPPTRPRRPAAPNRPAPWSPPPARTCARGDIAQIGQNLTTVALLNVADDAAGPTDTQTVAGYGGTVYASADAFYIAGSDYDEEEGQITRLFKFDIGPDSLSMVASGQVPGAVASQFSMDEEGDFFRVATNTSNRRRRQTSGPVRAGTGRR